MMLLPLTTRRGRIAAVAIVDDADYPALSRFRWHLSRTGYARRTENVGGEIAHEWMHRVLLGLAAGDTRHVDHINGNRIDNRRANLRVATAAQNGQNRVPAGGSSAHRGVTWNARCGKWQAQAKLAGRSYYLGLFDDDDEAARAASAFRRAHMPYSVEATDG